MVNPKIKSTEKLAKDLEKKKKKKKTKQVAKFLII
jgi:hypothetical protein